MKKLIKLLSVALAAVLACTLLAACGGGKNNNKKPQIPDDGKMYTYNTYSSIMPSKWSSHTWELNEERAVMTYTEMGLYDTVRTNTGGGFEWVCEMASAFPVDVTANYVNDPLFKDFIVGSKEQVWEFELNPDAKWENGDVINADTYVTSMKLLLDPKFKNYRANSFYSNDFALVNAKKYFNSASLVFDPYAVDNSTKTELIIDYDKRYETAENKKFYFSVTSSDLGINTGISFLTLKNDYGGVDFTKDGVDLLAKYKGLQNGYGLVEYTDANKAEIDFMIERYLGRLGVPAEELETYRDTFLFFNSGKSDAFDFENVGIKKTGDYKFVMVFEKPVTEFNVKVAMTSNFIVHEKTYLDNATDVGDLKTTKYGTKVDNYMAFGPYRIDSIQTEKEMLYVRNEYWYGYTDKKHEGQYQTDKIKMELLDDHNTALQSFLKGELDTINLNSTDMNTYRESDYLLKTDETYTWRFTFNTDEQMLLKMEEAGGSTTNVNTRIILDKNFRKAFSLAIDRAKYAVDCTAGEKPAYSLLSSLYYYDIENNVDSVYRQTDQAMAAICKLYGVSYGPNETFKTLKEAYDSITGYDVKKSAELFKKAWDDSVAAGKIDPNKAIQLEFLIPAKTLSDQLKLMRDFIDNSLKEMAKQAGLEGKISISYKADPNAYDYIVKPAADGSNAEKAGKYVVGFCAWGGASFYPYKTLGVYTDPINNKVNEYGFDPVNEKLSITADFDENPATPETTQEDTYYNWVKRISEINKENNGYADAGHPLKLQILAGIEYGLLDLAIVCPITTSATVEMYSKRIQYFTLEYNIFAAYGGIRQLTYKMDDPTWAQFCKDSSNLNYA